MSKYLFTDTKKITTQKFIELKKQGEKITMLTAYDYKLLQLLIKQE